MNMTTTQNSDALETSALSCSTSVGLSAGAIAGIAGIAVGAVLASGILNGVIAICWLRRRGRIGRRRSETGVALTNDGHEGDHLTHIWYEKFADSAQELPSSQMLAHELSVSERPVEATNKH